MDRDAAGHGWFVDRTPDEDSEFFQGLAGELSLGTGEGSVAQGVDLLTVLLHEIGHRAGYGHDDALEVMQASLPPGVRRTLKDAEQIPPR